MRWAPSRGRYRRAQWRLEPLEAFTQCTKHAGLRFRLGLEEWGGGARRTPRSRWAYGRGLDHGHSAPSRYVPCSRAPGKKGYPAAMRFPSRGLPVSLWCLCLLLAGLPAHAESPPVPAQGVAILPLGTVSQDILERVAQALRERLHVQVRFEPQRELPKAAWYAPRRRWRAEKLLEAIDSDPPKGAWKVVAITEAEISTTKEDIPDWGIAGLGSLSGQSCVLSTRIYRKHSKTQAALLRRMEDLAVHEFGHTLGFDHCETEGCVMADAKGKAVSSADSSTGHYCARCLGLLSLEDRARVKVKAGKPAAPGPR